MRILLFLAFTCFVVAQKISHEKYLEQLREFCSGIIKNVCTKENLELGQKIFENRFKEIQEEAIRKQKLSRKSQRIRKMKQMEQRRLLNLYRRHFLDRHM